MRLELAYELNALATRLQDEGAASFVKSWNKLMAVIVSKSAALQEASFREAHTKYPGQARCAL
jgi:hypothetical protein